MKFNPFSSSSNLSGSQQDNEEAEFSIRTMREDFEKLKKGALGEKSSFKENAVAQDNSSLSPDKKPITEAPKNTEKNNTFEAPKNIEIQKPLEIPKNPIPQNAPEKTKNITQPTKKPDSHISSKPQTIPNHSEIAKPQNVIEKQKNKKEDQPPIDSFKKDETWEIPFVKNETPKKQTDEKPTTEPVSPPKRESADLVAHLSPISKLNPTLSKATKPSFDTNNTKTPSLTKKEDFMDKKPDLDKNIRDFFSKQSANDSAGISNNPFKKPSVSASLPVSSGTLPAKSAIPTPSISPFSAEKPTPKPSPQKPPIEQIQKTGSPLLSQSASQVKPKDIVELEIDEKAPSRLKFYIVALFIILAAFAAGLAGYYYWAGKDEEALAPIQETNTEPEDVPIIIAPPAEKYSQDKPNYLVLDLSKLSAEDIKSTIIGTAKELEDKAPLAPYEYIVVDINNNPVAFPIFATAAKLNLSPNLLENMGEDFSLFLYNDVENIRLAISAKMVDRNMVEFELHNQELTFIKDADFMFLGNPPKVTSGKFNDSTYNNIPIRYINVDEEKTLSIDYAMVENDLVIATSKNTIRAVLDKISSKTTTQKTPVQEPQEQAIPAENTAEPATAY